MANYAIIIGINHYTPPEKQGLKTLKGPIPDANSIYEWLTTKGGVSVDNCHLITSTMDPLNPIKNDVDRAIAAIDQSVVIKENKDADRLYFYFAGHGLGVELDRENNGMCMADWDEWMGDVASLSSKEYLKKFLNEGLFKEIVIWMDCCRNTKLFLKPQGGPRTIPRGPNNNPKWFVGYATQHQNQAFEADMAGVTGTETRGIFTKVLLDALNGQASQNGDPIDASDLSDYLYFWVPKKAQDAGFTQFPETVHNTNKYNAMLFS